MNINFLAVFATAISNIILGAVWYSKPFFGKQWQRWLGKTDIEMSALKKNALPALIASSIAAILSSAVLAIFVQDANAHTFAQGMMIGFWTWLGFIVTATLMSVSYEGRKKELYFLQNSASFIYFVLAGGILAIWQ